MKMNTKKTMNVKFTQEEINMMNKEFLREELANP
jgi:hypothetical protein